jgi:monoamine oxidase
VVQHAVKSISPGARAETLQIKPSYSPELVRTVAKSVYQALKEAGLSDTAISMITSLNPVVNAFIFGDFDTEFVTEYALSLRNLYRIDGGMVNLPLAFIRHCLPIIPRNIASPNIPLAK